MENEERIKNFRRIWLEHQNEEVYSACCVRHPFLFAYPTLESEEKVKSNSVYYA